MVTSRAIKGGIQFGRIPYGVVTSGALAKLTPSAVLTYVAILAHVNREWVSRISHKRIAEIMGIARPTAASATTHLQKRNLIELVKHGGSNAGPNTYRVVTKCKRAMTIQPRPSVSGRNPKCQRTALEVSAGADTYRVLQSKNREERVSRTEEDPETRSARLREQAKQLKSTSTAGAKA